MRLGNWALPGRVINHGKQMFVVVATVGIIGCGGSDQNDATTGSTDQQDSQQDEQLIPTPAGSLPIPLDSAQQDMAGADDSSLNRLGRDTAELTGSPRSVLDKAAKVQLPLPELESRLQAILKKLSAEPESQEAESELQLLLADMLIQAETELDANQVDTADSLIVSIKILDPELELPGEFISRLEHRVEINGLLESATTAVRRDRLLAPQHDNALKHYRAALALDPGNTEALRGLAVVQLAIVERANADTRAMDFDSAEEKLDRAALIYTPSAGEADLVAAARLQINIARQEEAERLAARARQIQNQVGAHIGAGEFDRAELALVQLITLGDFTAEVNSLRDRLKQARIYKENMPGELIQDQFLDATLSGPIMVVIPIGSFFMGSPAAEAGRSGDEGPLRRVVFEHGFALGQREVTIAEFAAFINATGYVTDAENAGNSRIYNSGSGTLAKRKNVKWTDDYVGRDGENELPVIHVSWNDVSAYARWLSDSTGKTYRLPSEAEFEYALRAGSAGRYWWGEGTPAERVTNTTGDGDVSNNRRRWNAGFKNYKDGHWGPAPVGSFVANSFGLFDMAGNVSEWTNDCWHGNYVLAPAGGEAWINPGCARRVIRGGSWSSSPDQMRSAFRLAAAADERGSRVGFRLVREL